MFRGLSNLNLDAKGRLAMPSRYRDLLMEACGGRMVTTIHPHRCLLVYPTPTWESIQAKLMDVPGIGGETVMLQRMMVGHATDCELDGQGRFLVPPPLREFAGLSKEAVLIGQGNRFELWNAETWNKQYDSWQEVDLNSIESDTPLGSITL